MNSDRVLRVTNCFLLAAGSDICWFESKTRRYRPSLCGIINFVCLAICYAICFQHHFTASPVLQVLQDVSPFMHRLMRLQLLLGLKIFLFSVYENMRWMRRAGNGLAEVLPRNVAARRFSADEMIAYVLLFSTLLVAISFILYIAYEMEFKLPPLDQILTGGALFIPHFLLAGALRYFTIGVWLMRVELKRQANDLAHLLIEEQQQEETRNKLDISLIEDESAVFTMTEHSGTQRVGEADIQLEKSLLQKYTQLELLSDRQKLFDSTLQRQLGLLLGGMNNNCLLAGAYALTYFDSSWHVMFSERAKRVFYAGTYGIFVFIICDYLCLCLTKSSFDKEKLTFYENVRTILKQKRRSLSKSTRSVLKNMRDLLSHEFHFKMFGTVDMTIWNFLLKFLALVIALTVIYNYLNDQIISLTARLDEADATGPD